MGELVSVFDKAHLSELIAVTGLVILFKFDSNHRMTLTIDGWPRKTDRAHILCCFKLCAIFLSQLTLKFDGWPSETTGHLFYAMSSFVHYFVAIGEFKHLIAICEFKPERTKLGFDLNDFDLLPLTLAFLMTSRLSMAITPDNSTMVRWEKHCQNVWQMDRQADGQADGWTEHS